MKDITLILIATTTVNCFLFVPWAQPLPQIPLQLDDKLQESTQKKDLIVTKTSRIKPRECIFRIEKQGLNESTFEVVKGLNKTKEEPKPTPLVGPRHFGNFFPFYNRAPYKKGNIRTTTTTTTISTRNSIKGLRAIKYKPTMNESNFEVVKAANLRKDDPSNEYEQTNLSKVATKIAVELAMEKALKEVKEPKTPTLVLRPRPFGNFYPFSNRTPFRTTTISTTNSIKGLIAIKKYKPTKSTGQKSCRIININFYFRAICKPKSQISEQTAKQVEKSTNFPPSLEQAAP